MLKQLARQGSFAGMCPVELALTSMAQASIEERGAIFTRREVVEFILDLCGYTSSKELHSLSILEPSFGDGDFLLVIVERLMRAWDADKFKADPVKQLSGAIRAVELHTATYDATKGKVVELLCAGGINRDSARTLADNWLVCGDFLLTPLPEQFDCVVGNPPYVRQELVPDALMAEYRARYSTIYDRADIYIPFIERSLSLLEPGGTLGFICADRWMKNRYGSKLRKLVADDYHLRIYVDMVDTPAFHSDVIAYPAITVIGKETPAQTRVACRPEITSKALNALARTLTATTAPKPGGEVRELSGVAAGSEPWILDSVDELKLVRRLESEFPRIEDAGCKVGIGVATGADKAFIGPLDELDVEADRKLPLAMTRDILTGEVQWRGLGVVNPFADEGGLVDLAQYPRLNRYLEQRRDQIDKRHIAQKAPANWYRTIDRIYPALAEKPKLLIPDIKGEAHIVFEDGKLYPHHNLYFITSDEWDLRALQAVLQSGIARLFIAIYSTKMRGGYLRFQAQYLRKIRLPRWADVNDDLRKRLVSLAESGDTHARNEAVATLYGLNAAELDLVEGNSAQ